MHSSFLTWATIRKSGDVLHRSLVGVNYVHYGDYVTHILKSRHALLLNFCSFYGRKASGQPAQRYGICIGFVKLISLKQRLQVMSYCWCYVDFENAISIVMFCSFVIFQFEIVLFWVVLLIKCTFSWFTASCLFPSICLTYAYLHLHSYCPEAQKKLCYGIYRNIT